MLAISNKHLNNDGIRTGQQNQGNGRYLIMKTVRNCTIFIIQAYSSIRHHLLMSSLDQGQYQYLPNNCGFNIYSPTTFGQQTLAALWEHNLKCKRIKLTYPFRKAWLLMRQFPLSRWTPLEAALATTTPFPVDAGSCLFTSSSSKSSIKFLRAVWTCTASWLPLCRLGCT